MAAPEALAGSMDALVLHAVGDIRFERRPVPALRPGWARVRVAHCGVCGSDLPRIYRKGTYRFPTVPGHEMAGTVEAVAEDIGDLRAGDRVAVFPLIWCGRCAACERGAYAQCEAYDYLGSRSDGGFATYVAAPRANLIRVPEGVSLAEAAMAEPAAVALHALRRASCRAGESVAVFGAGPIGLLVAQWARAMGAAPILLFDVVDEKLRLARSLGFEDSLSSRDAEAAARVRDATDGRGAHVCVEAAGVSSTVLSALASARPGGRVVLLGNPSGDVTLPAAAISALMRGEVSVLGAWNSVYSAHGNDDDWSAVLGAVAARNLDLCSLVTHEVPLSRGVTALEAMRDGRRSSCKVLLHPDTEEVAR
ncbi:MAG: galactitol-1-phosphate 5-dehydrogenase [Chthonomonadales bacterium]|nr:galactitol-1-phosphate 5-dehydrogenase [Chthonomonadales bacterium]